MDIWILWEIFSNTIDIVLAISFLTIQLKLKSTKNNKLYPFIGTALTVFIITSVDLIHIQLNFNALGLATIYLSRFLMFGMLLIYAFFALTGNISEKLLWPCLMPFIGSLSNFISLQFMRAFTDNALEEVAKLGRPRFFVTFMYMVITIIIYLLVICCQRKKERINIMLLPSTRAWLICLMMLGTIAIDQLIDISFFAGDLSDSSLENKSLFASFSFFVILLNLFLLTFKLGKMTIDLVQTQHYKMVYNNYDELEYSYKATRIARHDAAIHLNTLSGLYAMQKFDDLGDYLSEMSNEHKATQMILTDNMPLNVLLSSKMNIARSHNIEFHFKAMGIDELCLPYTLMCSIVGNLLNNAIEACRRLPENLKREIRIEIIKQEKMLNIFVENSADGKYKQNGNIFLSSKLGELNGWGLKICKESVERLDGHILIDALKDCFKVAITIPFDVPEERSA